MGATDISGAIHAKLVFNTKKKGWSESYPLISNDFTDAVKKAKVLAHWRAAILGHGATLAYAVVSNMGKPPKSLGVIDDPLPGGIGVKYEPTSDWPEHNIQVNTAASGLRFRIEDMYGNFTVRGLKAFPDRMISGEEYTFGTDDPKIPDLGDYKVTVDFDTFVLPKIKLWDPEATYTTAEKAEFYSFDSALQKFLRVWFQATAVWSWTGTGDSRSLSKNGWNKIIYRGVCDRKSGRPLNV